MHGIIKSTKLSLFLFYSVPGKGSFSWGGKAKGERKEVFALCVLKEDWGGGDRVERGGGRWEYMEMKNIVRVMAEEGEREKKRWGKKKRRR